MRNVHSAEPLSILHEPRRTTRVAPRHRAAKARKGAYGSAGNPGGRRLAPPGLAGFLIASFATDSFHGTFRSATSIVLVHQRFPRLTNRRLPKKPDRRPVSPLQPQLSLLLKRPGFVALLELQKVVQGHQGEGPCQQNERAGVAKFGGGGSRHLHDILVAQHQHGRC